MKRLLGIATGVLVVLFAAYSLLPYWLPDGADAPLPDQPLADSRFVEIDGVRMHYLEHPPQTDSERGRVALLHGMAGSTYSWRALIEPLTDAGYRVVTPDLPPFGFSERVAATDAGTSHAGLVWGVLDEVGGGNDDWTLVGHSMGASVVAAMAAEPDRDPAGAVFIGGTADTADARGDLPVVARVLLDYPPSQRWLARVASYTQLDSAGIHELLASAYGREPGVDEVAAHLDPLRVDGTPDAFVRQILTAETVDSAAIGAVPAAVIWGTGDDWVPLEEGRDFAEALPEGTLTVIEQAAHCPMETHPGAVLETLLPFLESVASD